MNDLEKLWVTEALITIALEIEKGLHATTSIIVIGPSLRKTHESPP